MTDHIGQTNDERMIADWWSCPPGCLGQDDVEQPQDGCAAWEMEDEITNYVEMI